MSARGSRFTLAAMVTAIESAPWSSLVVSFFPENCRMKTIAGRPGHRQCLATTEGFQKPVTRDTAGKTGKNTLQHALNSQGILRLPLRREPTPCQGVLASQLGNGYTSSGGIRFAAGLG